MTPIPSTVACVLQMADLISPEAAYAPLIFASARGSASLALLGPGAFSIDGRLFGRRVPIRPKEID